MQITPVSDVFWVTIKSARPSNAISTPIIAIISSVSLKTGTDAVIPGL